MKGEIVWRIREPGTQISGTFNPIKFNRSTFYPLFPINQEMKSSYNGFILDVNWLSKRPIIAAIKTKDQKWSMARIPVDVIRLIFRWLDRISANDMMLLMNTELAIIESIIESIRPFLPNEEFNNR